MSFLYEVNLEVQDSCAEEFAQWLSVHIEEMLSFDGFVSATWYNRENAEENNINSVSLWTIHYQLLSKDHFSQYLREHAQRMRQEGMDKFGGQFSATRRLLYHTESYSTLSQN